MNNKGLLEFDMVDRIIERNKIVKFLSSKNNVLLVYGEPSIGKSFLFNNFNWKDHSYKKIKIDCSNSTTFELYIEIIKILDLNFKKTFFSFIMKNLKIIGLCLFEILCVIVKIFTNDHVDLSDIKFKKKNRNNKRSSNVLVYYLNKIRGNNKVVLIFDDVSKLNNENSESLIELIGLLNEADDIKTILITNEIEKNLTLYNFLEQQKNFMYLLIKSIEEKRFFIEIILSKFSNDVNIINYIDRIFEICNGKIDNLKAFFQSALLKSPEAIENTEYGFRLNTNEFEEYLNQYNFNTPFHLDTISSFIMITLIDVETPIDIKLCVNEIEYLSSKIFEYTYSKIYIYENIDKLINLQLVKKIDNKIVIFNNKVRTLISKELYLQYPHKKMITHYLYNFFNTQINQKVNENIYSDFYNEMLALYSFLGKIDGYIEVNVNYGLKIMDCGYISNAALVFDRLINEKSIDILDFERKIKISKCYYDNGEYIKSTYVINSISPYALEKRELFNYYYLLGNCKYITLNSMEAVSAFEKAEENANSINSKIICLNMKIQAYKESGYNSNLAEKTFLNYIHEHTEYIRNESPKSLPKSLSKLLRNSVFFSPINEAIELCRKAMLISEAHNQTLDFAFARHNYAYCLIKQNKIDEAKENLDKSLEEISLLFYHETAYCLNNLAVCHMFNNEYETALQKLIKASFASSSNYANYCIQTHIMMCHYKLNRIGTAESIANDLYNKVNTIKHSDPTILRRINMNLCIFYFNINEKIKAKKCLESIFQDVKNTLSEYRAYFYDNLLNENNHELLDSGIVHDTIIDFEPWLIMFGHDQMLYLE